MMVDDRFCYCLRATLAGAIAIQAIEAFKNLDLFGWWNPNSSILNCHKRSAIANKQYLLELDYNVVDRSNISVVESIGYVAKMTS